MTFKIPQRHNGRQSARGIVLGIYPNDGDGLYYPCLQEGRRRGTLPRGCCSLACDVCFGDVDGKGQEPKHYFLLHPES